MRRPTAIRILALFSICLALACPRAAAATKAALMPWESVPARLDVQRVSGELVALAQAELSAEPDIEWVERAELDKLVAEADLAASGRLDPRASLRVGRLARAQLLVTGRLDAAVPGATTLALEILDLSRGDLLAASRTPLPARPHKHYALRDEDRAAAVAALRRLLAEASARRRELEAKPAVALLFLANTGPSSRLDSAGARLADRLRSAASAAGGRVLDFPRARDAGAEQDLAVLGLADADDQAWRGVADLYLWGEYKEIPRDGVGFEQTATEVSLTLWDGAAPPRTETWRGVVASLDEAGERFAGLIASALRPAGTGASDSGTTAARLLADRAAAIERAQGDALKSPDFWTSELGKNFQTHRVHLLQTAAFLDPSAAAIRRALFAARWDRRAQPQTPLVEELWRQYADRRAVTEHFADPRGSIHALVYQRSLRAADLRYIIELLAQDLRGENRLRLAQIRHAAGLWVKEVNELSAWVKTQSGPENMVENYRRDWGDYLIGLGNGPYFPSYKAGVGILREMLDGAWPTLAPAFKNWFDYNPEFGRSSAKRYINIYATYGEEDAAYARALAALAADPTPIASGPRKSSRSKSAQTPADEEPDRPADGPDWTPPGPAAPHPLLGPELTIRPRTLYRWKDYTPSRTEAWRSAHLVDTVAQRLLQPNHVRLLGHDGRRLWLDGYLSPEEKHVEGVRRLALLAPDTREFDDIDRLLPGVSRARGVVRTGQGLYLATAFDGLIRIGDKPADTRLITPEQGLPSLKLTALAAYDRGIVAAAAPPEQGLARMDFADGSWLSLSPPGTWRATASAMPRSPTSPPETPPLLAGLGPWILVGGASIHLYDTRTDTWHPELEKIRADLLAGRATFGERRREIMAELMKARRAGDQTEIARLQQEITPPLAWCLSSGSAMLSDGHAFWIGAGPGLVRYDPERPPEEAFLVDCPPVLALADDGPRLWVAFEPEAEEKQNRRWDTNPATHALTYGRTEPPERRRSRIGLYDKKDRRWIGSLVVPGGITSLAAAPGRLWAAGSTLIEFDTRDVAPPAPPAGPAHDPAANWAGLAPLPLQHAAERNDLAELRRLIDAGENLQTTGKEGWTALHVAARAGHAEAAALLLQAGADLHAFTRDGADALGLAAASGNLPLVRRLLAAGASPSAQARSHLPDSSGFDPGITRLPDGPPLQPTSASVEMLPDGRARLRWEMPPDGNHDGFMIYRRDTPPPPDGFTSFITLELANGERVNTSVMGAVQSRAREWIDDHLRAPGVTSTYTVVAVNARARDGFSGLRDAGSVTAPPGPPPAAPGWSESHPRARDRTPLLFAAMEGRTEIVAALLAAGADARAVDSGGRGALHYAALGDHAQIGDLLIRAGAPLDAVSDSEAALPEKLFFATGRIGAARDSGADTALSIVYERRRSEAFFRLLLEAGASPLLGSRGALAPQAARHGREKDLERLLAAGPHPFVVDSFNDTIFTAAYANRRWQLARRLRELAIDPRHPAWPDPALRPLAKRAYRLALARSDLETTEWLLARGVTLPAPKTKDDSLLEDALKLDAPAPFIRALVAAGDDPKRLSAERVAAITDPEIRAALAAGPSPSPSDATASLPFPAEIGGGYHGPIPDSQYAEANPKPVSPELRTRFHQAAAAGDLATLDSLLADGFPIDAPDRKGWTALFHAVNAKQSEAARRLIDAGASLNRLTEYGSSILLFAIEAGDRRLLDEMLDLGADPNLVRDESASPLTFALGRDLALTRHLLLRGADPRLVVEIGGYARDVPPLFFAARQGNLAGVRLLVEHGADPKATLWRGRFAAKELRPGLTALPFAAASNDLPTLDYFLGLGLDPKWENAYGDNALDWAIQSKADATAARLRALGLQTRVERGLPAHEHR